MNLGNFLRSSAFSLSVLGLVCASYADPIQVAWGLVQTQPTSNGDSQVTTWAEAAILEFNTNNYPGSDLPDLDPLVFHIGPGVSNPMGSIFTASDTHSITLNLTGYQYIVISWGGSKIPNDQGTADYLYYINGTSTWTFYNSHKFSDGTYAQGDGVAALAKGGLSGIYGFGNPPTRVPDGGMSAILLGAGLIALGLLRRKLA